MSKKEENSFQTILPSPPLILLADVSAYNSELNMFDATECFKLL